VPEAPPPARRASAGGAQWRWESHPLIPRTTRRLPSRIIWYGEGVPEWLPLWGVTAPWKLCPPLSPRPSWGAPGLPNEPTRPEMGASGASGTRSRAESSSHAGVLLVHHLLRHAHAHCEREARALHRRRGTHGERERAAGGAGMSHKSRVARLRVDEHEWPSSRGDPDHRPHEICAQKPSEHSLENTYSTVHSCGWRACSSVHRGLTLPSSLETQISPP